MDYWSANLDRLEHSWANFLFAVHAAENESTQNHQDSLRCDATDEDICRTYRWVMGMLVSR